MKSWLIRVIIVLAAAIVLGAILLQSSNRKEPQAPEAASVVIEKPATPSAVMVEGPAAPAVVEKPELAPPPEHFVTHEQPTAAPREEVKAQPKEEAPANPLQIPREKIEEFLHNHKRDGASLLAAFHAASHPENPKEGLDYLQEAAAKFPGDSRVQLAMLAQDASPEERRKWLEAFKASAAGNSLADYLSASDYFKNNQPDAAVKELLAASSKQAFGDFAMESFLDVVELYRSGGASSTVANTAAMSAVSQDLLPQLSSMKVLAEGILDLQKQYATQGDTASVENLSQMGVDLANRLTAGGGGRFSITQMAGIALESAALQSLNQNATYDFLDGKTPAQRLEELKLENQEIQALTVSFASAFTYGNEAERDSYTERVKIYGELSAMRWMIQLHPAKLNEDGH